MGSAYPPCPPPLGSIRLALVCILFLKKKKKKKKKEGENECKSHIDMNEDLNDIKYMAICIPEERLNKRSFRPV